MKPLGIYVHIPFCRMKCNYCDFFSLGGSDYLIDEYVERLCDEISCQSGSADTIYFGGGTPSILNISHLGKIMNAISENFKIDEKAEVSIEVNPATKNLYSAKKNIRLPARFPLSCVAPGSRASAHSIVAPCLAKISLANRTSPLLNTGSNADFKGLAELGFNRISFGVQSANNNELEYLGRLHTFEEFLSEYETARKYFGNINVDLMYGIPLQTVGSWERTLKEIEKLKPEHISAYSLIIEPDTPFYGQNLPLPKEEMSMTLSGYGKYEVSNYCLEGFECRHNLKYWNMEDYIGFGAGAHSFLNGERFQNTKDLLHWEIKKEPCDYWAEYVFLGLRQTRGVKIVKEITQRYGKLIEKYVKNGMMIKEGGYIRFSERGMDISNYILADFV